MWGVAYEISDNDSETIQSLNSREKRYERVDTLFHVAELQDTEIVKSGSSSKVTECQSTDDVSLKSQNGDSLVSNLKVDSIKFPAFVFIGDSSSPLFLGDAPTHEIAMQIASAEGPSGPNRDYVFQLAHFMKSNLPNVIDRHLFDIEKELLHILSTWDNK